MNKDILIERSEILEAFNLDEFAILIDEQIGKGSTDYSCPLDHFKPIYYRYRQLKDMDMNSDLSDDLEQKFTEFCLEIIKRIQNAFNITLSDAWIDIHISDIPAITLVLYSFFILELTKNIEDAIQRFISLNVENLYPIFEDRKGKKDASTNMYMKSMSSEKALLMANIYDVATHVVETMTEEEFLQYLPEGYVPKEVLQKLFDDGTITGEFMDQIREIFSSSIELKSMICFNIESQCRNYERPSSDDASK